MKSTVNFNHKGFEVQAVGIFITDPNYGADADGNRGISIDMFDDFASFSISKDGQDVTDTLGKDNQELFDEINELAIDKVCETPLDDEPEYELPDPGMEQRSTKVWEELRSILDQGENDEIIF